MIGSQIIQESDWTHCFENLEPKA